VLLNTRCPSTFWPSPVKSVSDGRDVLRLAPALLLLSCGAGLRGQYFVKDDTRYRVAQLDPSTWTKKRFAENDLAWVDTKSGHVLAMNATCKEHGDPPLEVLTGHLLMGFEDKELIERRSFMLDGREALESTYTAKLDGVPIDITVVVMKKDGCVHDFTYVSPQGRAPEHRGDLEALLDNFTTTDKPPPPRSASVKLGTPEVRPEKEGQP
jgi:hypothetical protein